MNSAQNKIEIPDEILVKLKCSQCSGYLSSTPVMLKTNGENLCGNCAGPSENEDQSVTRNTVYEELATLVCFPCRYTNKGCTTKLPLGEIHCHEIGCELRVYDCPISAIENCTWAGKSNQMKQHFQENHANTIMIYPCKLQLNIKKNYESYYLTEVMNFLFVLQVKCNIAAAKLWFCVRFIGNPKFSKHFEFILDIFNDNGNVIRKRNVESIETLLLSQTKVLEIDINSLIQLFGHSEIENLKTMIKIKIKNPNCSFCNKYNLKQIARLESNGYICKKCKSLLKCKYSNLGCEYIDIQLNLPKHELLFCKYAAKRCIFKYDCKQIKESTNLAHLLAKHNTKLVHYATTECFYEFCPEERYSSNILLLNNIKFIREFHYLNSTLNFKILCDKPKTETLNYKCRIRTFNSETGQYIEKELNRNLDSAEYDWSIIINDDPNNSILYNQITNGVTTKHFALQTFIDKI